MIDSVYFCYDPSFELFGRGYVSVSYPSFNTPSEEKAQDNKSENRWWPQY